MSSVLLSQFQKKNCVVTTCVVPNLDGSMRVPFAIVDGDTLDVVADGVGKEVVLISPSLVVFLRRSFQRNLSHICSRRRHLSLNNILCVVSKVCVFFRFVSFVDEYFPL